MHRSLKTLLALGLSTFASLALAAPPADTPHGRPGEDCEPARLSGVLRDNVVFWARNENPVALAAQITDAEGVDQRVAWTLRVKTFDGHTVATWHGASPMRNGEGFASVAFDGRDASRRPLPAGTYVYMFDVPGYTVNGGFLRVLATDEAPEVEDGLAPLAASTNPNVPYNFYYGTQHAHTNYSDGGVPVAGCTGSVQTPHAGSDPAAAFAYAKTSGGVNWIDVIDHNHLLNEVCSGDCSTAGIRARYANGFTAAAAATDANFVGFYGMEWSTNANGHVLLADVNKIIGPAAETYSEVIVEHTNYAGLYTAASNPANQLATGAVGSFCHPETGQFTSYARTTDGTNLIVGIAVISGSASSNATDFRDQGTRYSGPKAGGGDKYQYVLQRGWKVGPEAHQDNHCANYGTHSRLRTVVLASSLTRSGLMSARKARRFFATSDMNAQMFFGTSDYAHVMGETFTTSAATLPIRVWAQDPDGSAISTVTFYEGDPNAGTGDPVTVAATNAGGGSYTATVNVPATGTRYWYAYVTLANGGELFSAPIWVSRSAGCSDTTLPTATVTAPTGSSVTGTVTVSATGSDNVGITGMTLKIDGAQVATSASGAISYSWNTTGLAAGSSHTLVATATDACGNLGTSTTKTVTIGSSCTDTTLPTATVTAPANGATVSGTVSVTASGTDNVAVTGMTLKVDGTQVATSASGALSYSWSTTGLTAGSSHTLVATASDACGNVKTSATTTVTIASSFVNPVVNGSFETGVPPTGWTETGSYEQSTGATTATTGVAVSPQSGSKMIWMAGYNNADDTLYQGFTVPNIAGNVSVSVQTNIKTLDGTTTAYDNFYLDVYNSTGTTRLGTLLTLSNKNASSTWVARTGLSLNTWKGQAIRLRFHATNDGSNETDFFVDNVVVTSP